MSGLLPLSNDIIAFPVSQCMCKSMIFCQFTCISAEIWTVGHAPSPVFDMTQYPAGNPEMDDFIIKIKNIIQ
jgi:hypothetical protein